MVEPLGDARDRRGAGAGLRRDLRVGEAVGEQTDDLPALRQIVQLLKLGKHIQLLPPRDFEGTEYTMTLRFKNQQDLSDLQRRIDKILEQPALGKILKR